jgi:hypothetical protein
MLLHDIDYSRVLQPQVDGYDIHVFQKIKNDNGYVAVDYPESMVTFRGKVAVVPKNEHDYNTLKQIDVNSLTETYYTVCPLMYNNVRGLVDVIVPNFESGQNYSGQHGGNEFGHTGAWGIMTSINTDNPVAAFANLAHELMHWKLVALGFGTGANTFFPTTQEFILNHESELCWSIVNSYSDTAQPAVGNKPTNRPVSASLHAYLSFLAVAYTHVHNLKHDPGNGESQYKAKLWGSRFDKCLDELWKVGRFTDKGTRLMMGISKWTSDFFYDAKQVRNLL